MTPLCLDDKLPSASVCDHAERFLTTATSFVTGCPRQVQDNLGTPAGRG